MCHFRIVPSGCTDIITSSNETSAQNEVKEKSADETTENDEIAEKSDKPEKSEKPSKVQNITYIFTRYSKQPAVVIPSADHFTTAVRCCPTIFKLRPHDEKCPPMIDLPYRMVFAVASKSSVYLYDTQQKMPFGSISNIHYSRLTDVTWSSDGKILIASSFDGFCTLISFEDGELGEIYDEQINLVDADEKENQSKKKRTSNESKNKSPPKEQKVVRAPTPKSVTPLKTEEVMATKPKIEIPETIIASAETFESPELKEKPATPIAIRRAPRNNPSTPSSNSKTPKVSETNSSKKPKLIETRRHPRNILPNVVEKTAADQDEALDAWPIPIDSVKNAEVSLVETKTISVKTKNDEPIVIEDATENMRLVYEGDSEMTLLKTETNDKKATELNSFGDALKSEPSTSEANSTPDNPKTPRRVPFRTISTPKSKKKNPTDSNNRNAE